MDSAATLALYGRLVAARARSQLQYRLSFALDLIGAFFSNFLDFLAIIILFSHLPRLQGWTFAQVAFFYGTATLAFAVSDLLVGQLDLLSRMIRQGTFDLILVRPLGSLFQVASSDVVLRRLGGLCQAVVVLTYALSRLHVVWTAPRLAMLIVMIPAGIVIYASVWVMAASVAFWTVDAQEVSNAFTYGGSFLASYPITIFGSWLRRLLAFVIPLAFVSYYPGLFIMGRHDPLGTPDALRFCTPLVAMIVALVAGRVWSFAVRRYRSTGS